VKSLDTPKDLLIINFSMDEQDPLLSHQIEAVRALAPHFRRVYVITGRQGLGSTPENVLIYNLKWQTQKPLHNILNFYRAAFPIIMKTNLLVFSHMTDVQASLIAPIVRLRGNKHYLWYAHKTYSKYLRWSQIWVHGIVTSTPGSCPVKSEKVLSIGQALKLESFNFSPKSDNPLLDAIHVGRFDPSKNISMIAENFIELRQLGFEVKFTQIGSPTTHVARDYERDFQQKYRKLTEAGVIVTEPSVPRAQIESELCKRDFFVHAYLGSLDKTLLEATLVGLPVVTLNKEYQESFGTWSNDSNPTLIEEFVSLRRLTKDELARELRSRRLIVERKHSLSNWVAGLLDIFIQA